MSFSYLFKILRDAPLNKKTILSLTPDELHVTAVCGPSSERHLAEIEIAIPHSLRETIIIFIQLAQIGVKYDKGHSIHHFSSN